MKHNFVFQVSSVPMPAKRLRVFHDDAGWSTDQRGVSPHAIRPDARVEWASVQAGQRLVGIARLEMAPPQFCYVSEVIVLSAYRGRGIGGWFMRRIEVHCAAHGMPRVLLRPVDAARAFYEKLAFVDDPLVAGFMKKELLPRRRLLAV